MDAWAIGDVVVDRHGQGERFLREQPNACADFGDILVAGVDIFPLQQNLPLNSHLFIEFEQPVETL